MPGNARPRDTAVVIPNGQPHTMGRPRLLPVCAGDRRQHTMRSARHASRVSCFDGVRNTLKAQRLLCGIASPADSAIFTASQWCHGARIRKRHLVRWRGRRAFHAGSVLLSYSTGMKGDA
ncbi:hypothetical protein DA2_1787 [Desulfovibrio sp. A2]|nr:hypothetical protein DA2_1787 [Desulfovibrio sp. A2]